MKKKFKKGLAVALTAIAFGCMSVSLASCGNGGTDPVVPEDTSVSYGVSTSSGKKTMDVGGTDKITITNIKGTTEDKLVLNYSSSDKSVLTVDADGNISAVKTGVASVIIVDSENDIVKSIEIKVNGQTANGYYKYSAEGWEKKAEILGVLEKYAQDTYLTGIPLAGDGSYIMYNDRVQKGVNTYIKNYGFGILQYGKLTSPLSGETNESYKNYYHNYNAEDPHTLNNWNSNSSTVSDLVSNMVSSYYGARLNEDKTDYEEYPVLAAANDFVCLDPTTDASPKGTKFKLYVKTGKDGLKYSNNSKNSAYAAFNGRGIELEDYVTAFKVMMTQKYNLYRGSEMIAADYARPLKGAAAYWNASKDGIDTDAAKAAWENVGVKSGTDDGGSYLSFEFNKALTVSDMKSNFSSDMYEPIPMDFITLVGGGDKYGTFSEDGSLTPVDTTLSLGAYTLEYYEKDKLITWKRNSNWIEKTEDTGMWNIEGIHTAILTAAKSDTEAAFKEFLDNKLDACSIPGTYLKQYQNDPRTTAIPETTVWKVNLNACNESLWEELFGEEGTVGHTSKDKYWSIKPIMSNTHFLDGLYYSINRSEFADAQNMTPSQNYLSKAYVFKDDDGVAHTYNETDYHKNALSNRYPDTYGYNLEASKTMFKLAIQEEVEAGHYSYGTASSPSYIDISAKWMDTNTLKTIGQPITEYMLNAFNSVDPRIQLRINNVVAGSSSDDMYDALYYGQFDIGMGAITGMFEWPLEFFQVLCSDNRSGFCLNWGVDTSVDDGKIFYDGKTWSYDALWEAGTTSTVAVDGQSFTPLDFTYVNNTYTLNDTDKSVAYEGLITAIEAEGVSVKLKGIWMEDFLTNSGIGTGEFIDTQLVEGVDFTLGEDGKFKVIIPDSVNSLNWASMGLKGYDKNNYQVDLYARYTITTTSGLEFDLDYLFYSPYGYNHYQK